MTESGVNSKRIARNTIILYLRMIVLALISLVTARVILNALGVEDYGIINVVGGLVALFSLFTLSMSTASGRFIACALGEGDSHALKKVFSTTINIHIALAVFLLMLLEMGGVWFLNTQMTIPENRLYAANWLFQSSVACFVIGVICVPYNACIIAHEHMEAFAYTALVDGGGKLLLAFAIYYYPDDKLILYAILSLLVTGITQSIYYIYCRNHFPESRYCWVWDDNLNKKLLAFSGWNFIGAGSNVLKEHGVNILLNIFCGPAINAARGIAVQINTVISQFAQNFTMALNPQITKTYAVGNNAQALKLVFMGSRFTFYLLLLVSLPVFLEAEFILNLWLSIVPPYTIIFVRLILMYNLTEAVSYTMVTLMLATGDIKRYQMIVGGCQMLNLPLAYLALSLGYPPETTIVVSITTAILCLVFRLYMLRYMVHFPVMDFLRSVLSLDLAVILCSLPLPLIPIYFMENGILRLLITSVLSVVSVAAVACYIGCSRGERSQITQFFKRNFLHAYQQK